MGQQILGSDKILRLNDYTLLGMVQSFDWAPAFNTQDIFELGRDTKVASAQELETSGSFEVLSIGGTPSLLARMLVDRTSSGVFLGYKYDPAGAPGKNAYTFTQTDMREAQFDIICHEKADQATYDRSVVLPRCYLTSMSGRADANGQAQETFNFGGDFVVGMPDPYHDVRAIYATRTTSGTATMADTSMTGYTLLYFYIDERRLRTTNTDPVYATMSTAGVVTITGMTIPATAVMRAIVYKTTPSPTFPVLLDADRYTTSFFTRGWQADIFIAPATPATPTQNEKWLRVQSCNWNIDLRVEALRQIAYNAAGTAIYCRLPTFPINISANASVFESDWADWKAILDPTVKPMAGTGTDKYGETYDFAITSMRDTFALVVVYYTKNGTKLQEWRFTDMKIDGYGQRVVVQGRAEINWTMRGTAFQLVGYNA